MNDVALPQPHPSIALSLDQAAQIRDSLLLGLDALGELTRLRANGISILDPDPDGTAIGAITASLRSVG